MAVNPNAAAGLSTVPVPSEGQYRFIKASTAPDLETQVERERASIVAASPNSRLVGFDLMGGGAGAVFQCRLAFNTDGIAAQNLPLVADCTFLFAEAAEPAQLLTETDRLIAEARALGLFLFGQGGAGGGSGAQFMVGYAFATLVPTPGAPGFLTQAAWFINADTGDDSNPGTALLPLASWAELARRWGDDPVLPQTTDVFIETNLNEPIVIRGAIRLTGENFLRIHGQVTGVLHAGSITAKTDLDPATQQPSEITDGAVGDWDTAGPGGSSLINERIRLTSGANVGAIAWLSNRLAATVARTSPFATVDTSALPPVVIPTQIDPAVADDYAVESLTTVTGFALSVDRVDDNANSTRSAALVENLAIVPDDKGRFENQGGMAILVVFCHNGCNRITGGFSTFSVCRLSARSVDSADSCISLASLWDTTFDDHLNVSNQSRLTLNSNSLLEEQRLQVFAGGVLDTNTGFAVMDTIGTALVVFVGGFVGLSGLFWGDGNTLLGIQCEGTGVVSFNSANKPTVTGAGGDTEVGGVAKAYAQIPFFNSANGASIVER